MILAQDSEVLIKAFKEHERRNGEKEGFAYTPADALAFKFYRDVSLAFLPQLTPTNRRKYCKAHAGSVIATVTARGIDCSALSLDLTC